MVSTTPYLQLTEVSKLYPGGGGVNPTSLEVDQGEMLVLLGPSGCGKTTLLNTIAGLLPPDTGSIVIGGRDITKVPTHQRNISMVFQTWALFPSMSVEDNVAFGLKMRNVPKPERRERVAEALDLVRLSHLAARKPADLSGGQQQRVALARGIVTRPDVLLLDEPLSSLDHQIRVELRRELRNLQRELGLTGVYVTHDHSEALALGDRIVVMRNGEVVESGEPRAVFARPRNQYTAEFLSVGTVLGATPSGTPGSYDTALGVRTSAPDHENIGAFCLKPTSVFFAGNAAPSVVPDADGATYHRASVRGVEYEPGGISYSLLVDSGPTLALFDSGRSTVELGDEVTVGCRWDEAIPLVA